MTSAIVAAFLGSFLASAVEFVEAVTVVLAVGVTRQWRSTLLGVAAASVALVVVVIVLGVALATVVPIELLRLFVGAVLIVFGLQWLTKAILRAAGARASRNETATFSHEVARLAGEQPVPASGVDWISFTVAFKGVLLEGLEVAFIVVTFGLAGQQLIPASVGAALAGITVVSIAIAVRAPLAQVPENTLKFGVGLMLVSFGTFWAGEGVGVDWVGSDLAIVLLLAGYLAAALVGVRLVAARLSRPAGPVPTQIMRESI
jgi:uncharacterized membrane protein